MIHESLFAAKVARVLSLHVSLDVSTPGRLSRCFALGGLLVAGSCRVATYPASFEYLDSGDGLGSKMEQIAHVVRGLDAAYSAQPVDRQAVIERLRALESLAAGLADGGLATNHPDLDRHLPAFQAQLTAARVGAEADPPSDFLAGGVVGLCAYCHR